MALIYFIVYILICAFVGRFLFYDLWFGEFKLPRINFFEPKEDPDFKEYKQFKKELEKDLEKRNIKSPRL